MAQQVPVPPATARLRLLERVDYEDAFVAQVDADLPPETWLRRALEQAPPLLLVLVRLVQRCLGLQLVAADTEHPLGWTVIRSDADAVVLGADGARGRARIVTSTPAGSVLVVTQAQFDSRRSRTLWRVAAPLHRRVARHLIDGATKSR
jgi:hypothetical protein